MVLEAGPSPPRIGRYLFAAPEEDQPSGSTFADLAAFLRRPERGGHPVDEVRECVCRSCGARSFEVAVMEFEGGARRTCLGCGAEQFIADSEDYWEDETEADYYCACKCGNEEFAAAVGYSLVPAQLGSPDRDVRWVHIGLRCLSCGFLGVYEDWKVSYGPSTHLLGQA